MSVIQNYILECYYQYFYRNEEILSRYGDIIIMSERMPELMCATMGNKMYTAHAADLEAALEFMRFVHARKEDIEAVKSIILNMCYSKHTLKSVYTDFKASSFAAGSKEAICFF